MTIMSLPRCWGRRHAVIRKNCWLGTSVASQSVRPNGGCEMSETRRRFVQGAIAATSSLAAADWLSLRSYAASCSSETRLLGFGAYNDTGRGVITYSTAIPYWKLGDC